MTTSTSRFAHTNPIGIKLRLIAAVMAPIQVLTSVPVTLYAANSNDRKPEAANAPMKIAPIPPDPTAGMRVNRSVPKVSPPVFAKFSEAPKDEEFAAMRVFSEPLLPIGSSTTPAENKALARALTSFARSGNPEDTTVFGEFLKQYPETAWRASLLANLGAVNRSTGYWSKAMKAWEESWKLSAAETEPKRKALSDYVLGELAQMNARVGRFEYLEKLFAEISNRDVRGPATEKIASAKQGLGLMQNKPEDAFRCGPMALDRILALSGKERQPDQRIHESRSTKNGMSLAEVHKLASELGLDYQIAKRSPGAKIIYPSVINWKVGHYAALVKENNGKFLSQDPTFTDDVWVSEKAIDEEGSGYYLVPAGKLPPGWQPVSIKEAADVWGKGNAGSFTPPPPPCVSPTIECTGCAPNVGMAGYNVDAARVGLSISDTPAGYAPPRGPAVNFTISYQQREVAPVSTPSYSNMGNKWSFGWISYLVVDPNNSVADLTAYGPSGGTIDYHGFNSTTQSYAPEVHTQVSLVKTGANAYEKRFPDGSKQVFALADGATVYPAKIFMTQSIDPQGNALTYTYDGSFRLVAVTDPLGQVTTLSYELTADPLKITKVTDPFGRQATLQYNETGQLWKVTDTIGLVSEFTYGSGDFITKLTTPYGSTTFTAGEEYGYRWLEILDPEGGKERVEYRNPAPGIENVDPSSSVPVGIGTFNNYLAYRNTFYWDKKAMAEAPGDYTKARITHWEHSSYDWNVVGDVPESTKQALEGRVWYEYPGNQGIRIGTSSKPIKIGRVLDDGTTQLYQYEYNNFGKVTKSTDPVGRQTTYIYAANDIDLLEVRQTTGSINELLVQYTYNLQHLPLTVTDTSGQTTTYSYYPSGQIHTVTNAKQEVTTYNYDSNGYLQTIVGHLPGATTSFTYDGFGRLRTTTDSEGYSITVDYDAIDGVATKTLNRVAKITYPDGTYEQTTYDRLDAEWTRDRLGRWSRKFYDALRHVIATQDPLNRIVTYDWCNCGSLDGITDAEHNVTSWRRDVQGRVTDKVYADNTQIHYTYEATTSRLIATTDAKNQTTNYAYFSDNNIQQVSYANAQISTPSVSYTYDPNYNRLRTMTDGTGLTTYAYNPVAVPPTLGAARLQSADGPLTNDTIAYSYDELGRVTGQSINGAANASTGSFDGLGRLQSVTNALGVFTYSYVNATSRIDHVDIPGGQQTQYAYFDNLADQRLREIKNLGPSSAMISAFDYTYDPLGEVTSWTQNNTGLTSAQRYNLGYDAVDQLRVATLSKTSDETVLKQYDYDYDEAGNRTTEQNGSAITTSASNNLNQLVGQSGGGKMHFRGTVSEPSAVTAAGSLATVDGAGRFDGVVDVNVGSNTVSVVATDGGGNARTNNYQVTVSSGVSRTLSYDLEGNLTGDGSKGYEWDAANRCVAINLGTHRTELSYDGRSREIKRVEKENGLVTETKQFIWDGWQRTEERDAANQVIKRFFIQGEQIAGNAYFYSRDHLGSIREMTDGAGVVRARYDYDLYGVRTKVLGDLDAALGFTGHFVSNHYDDLAFAPLRVYSANWGRWLSRDPIGEDGGLNLYGYVFNNPGNRIDVLGLDAGVLTIGGELLAGGGSLTAGEAVLLGGGAIAGAAVAGYWLGDRINQATGASDALGDLLYELSQRRGRWTCTASCNVQKIDPKACCPDRTFGTGCGPTETTAAQAAIRDAQLKGRGLTGCYVRHCHVKQCWRN